MPTVTVASSSNPPPDKVAVIITEVSPSVSVIVAGSTDSTMAELDDSSSAITISSVFAWLPLDEVACTVKAVAPTLLLLVGITETFAIPVVEPFAMETTRPCSASHDAVNSSSRVAVAPSLGAAKSSVTLVSASGASSKVTVSVMVVA